MQKWLLILGGILLGLIFLYGSLTALVKQGLSPIGAVVMLVIIIGAGIALLRAVKE
jgi:hypothetical protein